jgi:hypothetical protein
MRLVYGTYDDILNKVIRSKLRVASIEENMSHVRWFDHMQWVSHSLLLRHSNLIQVVE